MCSPGLCRVGSQLGQRDLGVGVGPGGTQLALDQRPLHLRQVGDDIPLLVAIMPIGGLHLTGLDCHGRGSPRAVGWRAFQAGWVSTPDPGDRWDLTGSGVDDQVVVADRLVSDRKLEDPVEHQPEVCLSECN
jgi:hypothetical protein